MFKRLYSILMDNMDFLIIGVLVSIILLFLFYFLIKTAVKNGILSAFEPKEGRRDNIRLSTMNGIIDAFSPIHGYAPADIRSAVKNGMTDAMALKAGKTGGKNQEVMGRDDIDRYLKDLKKNK